MAIDGSYNIQSFDVMKYNLPISILSCITCMSNSSFMLSPAKFSPNENKNNSKQMWF